MDHLFSVEACREAGGKLPPVKCPTCGALTHDTIVSYLNRCLVKGPQQISDASGGAGIGLYRVFQSLSKFIINIEPGRRTEVISLIDLRLSMKQFRQLPKSFHIFVSDSAASTGAAK
jgi:hypothetical protein